jgi:hypothetical protein
LKPKQPTMDNGNNKHLNSLVTTYLHVSMTTTATVCLPLWSQDLPIRRRV